MDVFRVPVSNTVVETPGESTNAYIVGTDSALLVDPGGESDELDAAIADRAVDHIAVTHHHPDHVAGISRYAAETGATVWARRGREQSFRAATGVVPDRTLRCGTAIETDAGHVRVLETPGHAPEHVSFAAGDSHLVGDLAVASGSVVVGAPEGDMRAYLGSLRRVYVRAPATLYPGHGSVIDAPQATVRRLIDHRREREHSVLSAVEAGAASLPEITDAAYEKDVSDVRRLAEATVKAHLEKLAVEKQVVWDGTHASVPE
ncbi:MBL fold metallo-hydrolase [Halocatena pleomorpha]|uniref:MBL fold metallo-hydrolase n=1 Tax=Halocatena pleomorpha TaxID=1785090 RepID=A0A3P3R683_9EURY|nr:MBL fold metallo-hydrolase [Halocatena pleomorpha]RRJ28884.1 MBL fold metallo-hydrolase [Halocatena pleomorpha]